MLNWCHANLSEDKECEPELAQKQRVTIPLRRSPISNWDYRQGDAIVRQLNADKGLPSL